LPKDTLTFSVNGSITLERFAVAIRRFTDLVAALNREFGAAGEVDWLLDDLQYGSATATARAVPKEDDDELWRKVEEVVESYLVVGQALETAGPIPYSNRVQEPAIRIRQVLENPGPAEVLESLRFETEDDDVTIEPQPRPHPLPSQAWPYAFGAVEGRIQTLTMKGKLRFTLYDLVTERAISCYLDESLPNKHEIMKDVWGKVAVAEGAIRRDPSTGRPLTVRRIRRISILDEPIHGGYREARGALKWKQGMLSSEDAIRRVRDAG